MNRIDEVFLKLFANQQKALIPYVSCGDPSLEFTEALILQLAQNGADLIELGVPYSDPIADGPVIQRASGRALAGGVSLEDILSMAKRLRSKTQVPLIIMTYYNPIYVMGVETFIKNAALMGIDGLIIPDLPIEEATELKALAEENGVKLILLVAPTSTSERIKRIAELSGGFIYCVSIAGVTGAREATSVGLEGFLKRIRKNTTLPLCVGFGISNAQTAQDAAKYSDGIIVGSALIEIIEKVFSQNINDIKKASEEAGKFIRSLKEAIR